MFISSVNPPKLNEDIAHIITDMKNITVTTLYKNPFDLFQAFFRSALSVGTLYSGSSNTNGSNSVLYIVLFKIKAIKIATTIPNIYRDVVIIAALSLKNIFMNKA